MRAAASQQGECTGFTLIELLVVVTIIAILAALLLPALKSAQWSGKRVACASWLHQLHVGLLCYDGDYQDTPFRHAWGGMTREAQMTAECGAFFQQYLRSDIHKARCPTLPPFGSGYGSGYCYYGNYTDPHSMTFFGGPGPRKIGIEELQRTAERARAVTGTPKYHVGQWLLMNDRIQILQGTQMYDVSLPVPHANYATSHLLNNRVTGGNLLWIDGSVVWRSVPQEIAATPWPSSGNNSGPGGWIRYAVPYVDVIVPVETIDLTQTWTWSVCGNGCWDMRPFGTGNNKYVAGY